MKRLDWLVQLAEGGADYRRLLLGFLRVGVLGYGGGPSMIPLVHAEAVKKYGWLTDEEFADVLAMGNALPGPIATKMASYIGYKVKGWTGACVAVGAMVVPVLAAMIVLLGLIYRLQDSGVVGGMTAGVQPVIGVMMAVLAYEFFKKAWLDWKKSRTVVWTLFAAVTIVLLNVSPGLVIGIALAYAFIEASAAVRRRRKTRSEDA